MDNRLSLMIIGKVAKLGITKWIATPRMYMVALLAALFVSTPVSEVRSFAIEQGLSVSNWFFPLIFEQEMILLFLYFCVILMFCNAPFVDKQQMFVLLRSGKRNWFLGQLLYITLSSIIYFVYLFVLTIVEFIPYVGFSDKWESVFVHLGQHTEIGVMLISGDVISHYTPLQASLIAFLINVLLGIMLGELIFLVNLFKNRGYGTGVALAVVLFSYMLEYMVFGSKMSYISPVAWADISITCSGYSSVPLAYILPVLICGDILLAVLIMYRSRRYSIEEMEEI